VLHLRLQEQTKQQTAREYRKLLEAAKTAMAKKSVLQRVAACCSVLQRVAACCSGLQMCCGKVEDVLQICCKCCRATIRREQETARGRKDGPEKKKCVAPYCSSCVADVLQICCRCDAVCYKIIAGVLL